MLLLCGFSPFLSEPQRFNDQKPLTRAIRVMALVPACDVMHMSCMACTEWPTTLTHRHHSYNATTGFSPHGKAI